LLAATEVSGELLRQCLATSIRVAENALRENACMKEKLQFGKGFTVLNKVFLVKQKDFQFDHDFRSYQTLKIGIEKQSYRTNRALAENR